MSSPERLSREAIRILQPHFPELELDRVTIHYGIPWYVIPRPLGYTDGYRVYLDAESLPDDPLTLYALISHELEHVRQYRLHGKWRFRWKYVASYLRKRMGGDSHFRAYREIEFEVEARDTEFRVSGDLLARSLDLPGAFEQSGRDETNV